jgi:ABC-type phosphate transport system substrate-binding protein
MSKYPMIAAAVAAAVASGYANAALPTFAQANAPTASLVMSGSSAAAPAVTSFVESQVCGGSANTLLVTSSGGTKNFLAFSCFVPTQINDPNGTGAAIPAGSVVTVYYRTEGGSVVGALPIATGRQIKRLNLADASCTGTGLTATCTVGGTTSIQGLNDSWTTAVVAATTQLGVTDVEPGQLTNADYPTNYASTAFGSATVAQLQGLATVPLLQQVFGLAVNTSGQGFSAVNLTRESAANILNGTYANWNKVPDATTGAPVAAASHAIVHVDREPGSGTRTSANIYFLGYQCGSTTSIPANPVNNFSTGDELTLANSTPGAIAYASIDNFLSGANSTKFPNLVLASINGVTPSNLAAATGKYDYWFEATLVPNPAVAASSNTATLSNFLQVNLPDLATAPQLPDVNVIPFAAADNNATVPLTNNGATGTLEVYVNPFSRNGNSCNVPAAFN